MKIREIMTTKVQCVHPGDSLVDAAALMRKLDVGVVPVCIDHEKLSGILTDRDIAIRAVAEGRDLSTAKVEDVLSPGVVCAYEDQDVDDAVHVMEQYQIRRLPVLNRNNRLVGIVSLGDVAVEVGVGLSGEALQEVSAPGDSHVEDPANR